MLHLPTVISLSFILNLFIGLFFFSVYRYKKQTSFLLLGVACLTFSFAELLACLRLLIDAPFVTHYLANVFVILSPFLVIIGLHKYKHTQLLNLQPLYITVGFSVLLLLTIYPYSAGQLLTSLTIAGLFLYIAFIIKSMSFVAISQKKALIICFLIHSIIMFIQAVLIAIPVLNESTPNSNAPMQLILSSHLILTTCSALILPYLLFSNTEHTLSSLANTDPLSQLFNRRGFFTKGKEILSDTSNINTDVSIIMLDIDFFKRVNDEYGHDTGDHAIKWIAQHIKEQFTDIGISSRIGGEEFAILLPSYTLGSAKNQAEKLRESIRSHPFHYLDNHINLSVSAGVSHAKSGHTNMKDLLSLADKRLYLAKESGRDKVVTFDEKHLLVQN
jgi:diguanylate cyclase (GGDEF)-like protein